MNRRMSKNYAMKALYTWSSRWEWTQITNGSNRDGGSKYKIWNQSIRLHRARLLKSNWSHSNKQKSLSPATDSDHDHFLSTTKF